ncbi:MAG: hypothetical protein DWQ07_25975 [Chloroflexi bacterium]|nr:MAG: hypothetical protein DWQ07_25975 [Chloroflexota bacterium]
MKERKPQHTGLWESILKALYNVRINSDIDTAIEYSTELFQNANSTIWIVGGNLNNDLWGAPEVINELEEASNRNIEIRIIHGPSIDPNNLEITRLHEEGRIELQSHSINPSSKFIVVDKSHVRLEEVGTGSAQRSAFVVTESAMLGNRLAKDFTKLWQTPKLMAEGTIVRN